MGAEQSGDSEHKHSDYSTAGSVFLFLIACCDFVFVDDGQLRLM